MANEYYTMVRHDAIALMERAGSQRVLEIGCGAGNTLKYLRQQGYAGFVAGVELEPGCHEAAQAACDSFFPGDVEQLQLRELGSYHAVLLLDVIEHLVHPFDVVKAAAGLLNPGGYLVLSFPNIRNFAVLKQLVLEGLWDYRDSGILDRGHLRFFTRKSFLAAMAKACPMLELEALQTKPNRHTMLVRALSRLPWIGDFFCCQFLVKYRLVAATTP